MNEILLNNNMTMKYDRKNTDIDSKIVITDNFDNDNDFTHCDFDLDIDELNVKTIIGAIETYSHIILVTEDNYVYEGNRVDGEDKFIFTKLGKFVKWVYNNYSTAFVHYIDEDNKNMTIFYAGNYEFHKIKFNNVVPEYVDPSHKDEESYCIIENIFVHMDKCYEIDGLASSNQKLKYISDLFHIENFNELSEDNIEQISNLEVHPNFIEILEQDNDG